MSLKLSPSALSFLKRECYRCFTMKVRYGIDRPNLIFPRIFTDIDLAVKKFYHNKSSTLIVPGMPKCKFIAYSVPVKSTPFQTQNMKTDYHIEGEADALVQWADGSFGVIDFKTSHCDSKTLPGYRDQLEAYSYAFTHPEATHMDLALKHPELLSKGIQRNGLIVFEPSEFSYSIEAGIGGFMGKIAWVPSVYNEAKFMKKMETVDSHISGDIMPNPGWFCEFCAAYSKFYEIVG